MRARIDYIWLFAALTTLVGLTAYPSIEQFLSPDGILPELLIKPQKIDLGKVSQGSKVPFTFSVTNSTSSNIDSINVQTSCGCTLVDSVFASTLSANDSRKVTGTFDTSHTRGRKSSHILIKWPGQHGPADKIISISADVIPIVTIVPQALAFRMRTSVNENSDQILHVELRTNKDVDFAIVSLRATHPALLVKQHGSMSRTSQFAVAVLDITFNSRFPNIAALTGKSSIEVQTNIPTEPILQIPVSILL